MKRVLFLLTASAFVLSAAGNIVSTKHNLSASSTAYGTTAPSAETQLCKFCHTPHGAATATGTGDALKFAPLWGHNSTIRADFGTPTNANGAGSTFACLSCHDGSVAINNNSNVNTSDGDIAKLGALTVGTATNGIDMWDASGMMINKKQNAEATHPVNVDYTTYETKGYLVDHTTWVAGTPQPRLFNMDGGTDKYVQCSSCHTVHGDAVNNGPEYQPLLRVKITGSALCLSCHKK